MSLSGPTRVLLVGGSSEIGLAIVRRLAAERPIRAVLLGRDLGRMQAAVPGLERGGIAPVVLVEVDAEDLAEHQRAVADAFDRFHGFDLVVLAVGKLGAQAGLDASPAEAEEVMRTNFLGAARCCCTACAGCASRAAGR